jgi:hypothetical protein
VYPILEHFRRKTRLVAKESKFKLITDQIETMEPKFDKSKYLPKYNHAYTMVKAIISCAITTMALYPMKMQPNGES